MARPFRFADKRLAWPSILSRVRAPGTGAPPICMVEGRVLYLFESCALIERVLTLWRGMREGHVSRNY